MAKDLNLTRIFDAPRSLVFKAWIDPSLLAQWWSPRMFSIPVCELDVRPGGAMLVHMRGPDGIDLPMTGTYHEVVAPERLVFTSRALIDENGAAQLETLVTVTFSELNGKTKVILQVEVVKATPAAAGALDGMAEGWSQSLDKLSELLVKA